jgi:predicted amidohydrolase
LKSGDGTRVLNTHLIINDQGEIVGRYVKVHLFDVQAGSLVIRESDFTQAGSSIVNPIETPAGRIGLGIVYLTLISLDFFSVNLVL